MWRRQDAPWTYHRLIGLKMKLEVTQVMFTLFCEHSDTSKEIEVRLPGTEWGYFKPYFDLHNLSLENRFEHDSAYIPVAEANRKTALRLDCRYFFSTEGACYDYPYLLQLGIEDETDRQVIKTATKEKALQTSESPDTRMMIFKALSLYNDLDNEEIERFYTPDETLKRLRASQKLVPFVLVDRSGMFSEMSDAWRDVWGVSWQTGATPWTMSPGYQPCGTSSHKKAQDMMDKCCDRGHLTFDWVHTHIATGKNYHCRIQLIDAKERGVIGRMVGERGRECPLSELQAALDHDEASSLPNSRSRFG